MSAEAPRGEEAANENAPTVLCTSDRALSLLGWFDTIVAESVDTSKELEEGGIIPVFFDKDELESFRAGLERLACDLRDVGR